MNRATCWTEPPMREDPYSWKDKELDEQEKKAFKDPTFLAENLPSCNPGLCELVNALWEEPNIPEGEGETGGTYILSDNNAVLLGESILDKIVFDKIKLIDSVITTSDGWGSTLNIKLDISSDGIEEAFNIRKRLNELLRKEIQIINDGY